MAVPAKKSETIGDLLRFWRQLKKISQMDLAFDTGISPKHLSFVETGRAKPSRKLVLKIAHTLKLPLRHVNSLLNAAGYSSEFRSEPFDGESMDIVRNALQRMIDKHEPYPSVAIDSAYNILLKNTGFEKTVKFFLGENIFEKYDNVYRLTFAEDGLRHFIKDWPFIEHFMLNRLWEEAVSTQNADLFALHEEISDMKTGNEPVGFQLDNTLPILNLTLEKDTVKTTFFSTITTLGTPLDLTAQELRIESLFPMDGETKEFFI